MPPAVSNGCGAPAETVPKAGPSAFDDQN